ncbi:hypothetical protein DFH06DRAFT_1481775 [Mycena polygramma]|nr:hypothetical protein DFH06DRAFT_1481775 [Mycena polygramma]
MLAELEADRLRVAELQPQIAQLESALSELRLEKSQAQERLESYKYPVMTLPNELVSEIFVRVLPPYPEFPQLFGRFSPTTLTQICQRWRTIALGTPALWSAISTFTQEDDREADIFELWLERSRHYPLSIALWTDEDSDLDSFEHWVELVEAVVPHRACWEYLQIDIHPADKETLDGPMPLLRHLDLRVDNVPQLLANGPVDFTCYAMPLLRTLVLGNTAALRTKFCWPQLTSLTFPDAHPSKYVPILVQTRNLVHCELRIYTVRDHGHARPQQDIQLPCLEFLSFIHVRGGPVTDFLPTLIVPALRNLEIPESYLAPDPVHSLTAFMSKSGCRLEKLDLTGVLSVPAQTYRESFPLIRKLTFNHQSQPFELI